MTEFSARKRLLAAIHTAIGLMIDAGAHYYNHLDRALSLETCMDYVHNLCAPGIATHTVRIMANPGNPEAAPTPVTYTSLSHVSMIEALTLATAALTKRAAQQFASSMLEEALATNTSPRRAAGAAQFAAA